MKRHDCLIQKSTLTRHTMHRSNSADQPPTHLSGDARQQSSSGKLPAHRGLDHGFTLLELLVVIVIIGLLSGLVVPRYFDTVGKSKAKIAKAQMTSLEQALDQYRLDVGSYPSPEQGLNALVTQPTGVTKWQGPYLKKDVPKDPWDQPYIYKLSATQKDVDIVSLGSDGQPGGSGEAKDIALSDKD